MLRTTVCQGSVLFDKSNSEHNSLQNCMLEFRCIDWACFHSASRVLILNCKRGLKVDGR